jgi:hypothetical protein
MARVAARFTAVVVLPQPPFKFAIAIILISVLMQQVPCLLSTKGQG